MTAIRHGLLRLAMRLAANQVLHCHHCRLGAVAPVKLKKNSDLPISLLLLQAKRNKILYIGRLF